MFKNNLVAVVKCNGRIVNDIYGEVRLPFGSDYTLYFKNKDSRRVVVNVDIDGADVLDGSSLVINGNSTAELKGRIGGTNVKNFFRFIKKTRKISEYRGDKIDDGLVRISFKYEDIVPSFWYPTHHITTHWYDNSSVPSDRSYKYTFSNTAKNSAKFSCNVSDNGLTVDGAETYQNFTNTHIKRLESKESVIVLSLKGLVKGKKINKPEFIRDKITCNICGTKHRLKNKFCSECGSYLRKN